MTQRTMSRVVCTMVLAGLGGCAESDDAPIREVLDAQAAAWNRGDIEAFMDGYLKSDELTFESTSPESGSSVEHGWQATLDRYRRKYPTSERMGRLTFSELAVERRGHDRADVRGRYRVDRSDGPLTGRFTLDMRRIDGQWRIVRDVTVAD